MKKLRGGIGALTAHLVETLERERRRGAAAQQGDRDPGRRRPVSGVRTEAGETITAPIVVSAVAPDLTSTT